MGMVEVDSNGTITYKPVYPSSSCILEPEMESFLGNSDKIVENEDEDGSFEDSSSTPSSSNVFYDKEKAQLKQSSSLSEIDMMKERFAKLLLGEDMSGCGNGVCTALAISNAITNLFATIFGQIWRLEPLHEKKKVMWRREMEWILSVSDHIVELIPSWQIFSDGSKLEVMTSRPRSDLYINLPALRKLDTMLLETLDSFDNVEFWYVDQGIIAPESDGSSSFRKRLPHQEDKWWLPVPQVSINGLSEDARKDLQYRRDSTNQILKAAMAINSNTLAEMDVPESYLETLPKNARASLGDLFHRYISSEQFSPECLLECLDLSSEHQALEIVNRVEAAIHIFHHRMYSKPLGNTWEMVKDLMSDADKRKQLGDRAESLLLCLKQRFPGLPQTTLDMSKIQFNKDVGKAILESYSRVLESLAFNIIARIDDLLYVDDVTKNSDQSVSISKVEIVTTPTSSPAKRLSNAKAEKSKSLEIKSSGRRGFSIKKILTDYLMNDSKGKASNKQIRISLSSSCASEVVSESTSSTTSDGSKGSTGTEAYDLLQGKDDFFA